MIEKDAEKLANKIARAVNSAPDDVLVFLASGFVSIIDKEEFKNHFTEKGDVDNIPEIASSLFKVSVLGNDSIQ